MGAAYLVVLVVLFVLGIPAAFAMGGTSALLSLVERGPGFFMNCGILAQKSVAGVNNFLLLSVPFFLYAGKVMNTGGITRRIFTFCEHTVGWLRGGLGHVNILASVIFAGMTGTAVSDAAGLGAVELKAMEDAGYPKKFSVAVTSASSAIGPIIPPSVPLVIYGMMTSTSIGKLLIAGIVPGILMALGLAVAVEIYAYAHQMPKGIPFNLRKIVKSFGQAFFPLMTPVIIIGGMTSGFFTPTEASAIAAVYATVLSVIVYKEITWKRLWEIIMETAVDTGTIMVIVSMAMIYGYMITRSNITMEIARAIAGISTNPVVIGLILVAFLMFVGCFMEATAAITILSPVFLSIYQVAGIDPMAFGIVMVLTLMIGLFTPPFGMILFIMSKLSGISIRDVVAAIMPFILPLLAVDILLAIFPQIVTFLPNLLM